MQLVTAQVAMHGWKHPGGERQWPGVTMLPPWPLLTTQFVSEAGYSEKRNVSLNRGKNAEPPLVDGVTCSTK